MRGDGVARPILVPGVPVAEVPAAVARGGYLYASRGCADCHGRDGAGRVFVDSGSMRVAGPALAPGPHSAVAGYAAPDWDRAVRHGVAPGGRPLLIMPSEDYNRLTDDDLAALVAYVRSMPGVPGQPRVLQLSLPTDLRALHLYLRSLPAAS